MAYRNLLTVFFVVSVFTAVIGLLRMDWMLVGTEFIAVLAVYIPYSRDALRFPAHILWVCTVFSFLIDVLAVLHHFDIFPEAELRGVSWYWIVLLLCMFVVVFTEGLMLSALIDRYTESSLSERWMLVFAIVYSLAFSGVYLFMLGFDLWYTGQPFGYEDIDKYGWEINVRLMVPSTCAIITSLLASAIGRAMLRDVPKERILSEGL